MASNIYQLKENELVHVECVKCSQCAARLDESSEYSLGKCESRIQVMCKTCTLNESAAGARKKRAAPHHRLSSRQKEQLVNELLVLDSLNLNLSDESDAKIVGLADKISCSPKTILFYLSKYRKKNTTGSSGNKLKSNEAIKSILDQLSRIDCIVAPNKCPFTVTKASSSSSSKQV